MLKYFFLYIFTQSYLKHIYVYTFLSRNIFKTQTIKQKTISNIHYTNSYQILNPRGIKGLDDPKKATKILIESTSLDEDQYRLGNTKARIKFF